MLRPIVTFTLFVPMVRAVLDTNASNNSAVKPGHYEDSNYCKFFVRPESIIYWKGKIAINQPDAIHFNLNFIKGNNSIHKSTSQHVLKPLQWVWTFNRAILNWPLDHALLSFGFLDVNTVFVNYVNLEVINPNVSKPCYIALGTNITSRNIAEALKALVNENDTEKEYPEHDTHMFCFLHFNMLKDLTALRRFMALYFQYPLALLNYRCSNIRFDYYKKIFQLESIESAEEVWKMCVIAPYVASIILIMYFPITVMEICAWLSQDEQLNSEHYRAGYTELNDDFWKAEQENDWIMSDGSPPLTVISTFAFLFKGLRQQYPILKSRVVRFIGLVVTPLLILPQLLLYRNGINYRRTIIIDDLLQIEIPTNFLSLLSKNATLMFTSDWPYLGGPIGVLVIYFVFGFILIVFPKNLKQVVENGMPASRGWSPLFLGAGEIIKLAGIHVPSTSGYAKAAVLCKCSIYLLLSRAFWAGLFGTQSNRFKSVLNSDLPLLLKLCLYMFFLLGSVLEIVLCVMLYGFPLICCLCITLKGAVVSIASLNDPLSSRRSVVVVLIYPFFVILWSLFTYSMAMIFLQVFMFASQVILFCFVAVFTYPSVSFGYLFFSVVLIFYVVQSFGEYSQIYQELLHTAVEISSEMNCKINDVVVQDETLYLNNFAAQNIKKICLNGCSLSVPVHEVPATTKNVIIRRTIVKDDAYGIPKDLFDRLVDKHKPVHVQMLHLLIKFAFLAFFVTLALGVTSRSWTGKEPNTEISEVMHVMFVVVLGAVPKMLEVALFNESASVLREIEHRRIEKTIEEYWHEKLKSCKE